MSYVKDHSCHLKKKIAFFPPSPPKLVSSIFLWLYPFAIATHLFYNGKMKI